MIKERRSHSGLAKFNLILLAIVLAGAYWVAKSLLAAQPADSGFTWQLLVPRPQEVWIRILVVCLLFGFAAYAQYLVSVLRRAEQESLRSKDLYRTLVENLKQCVFLKDADLRFVSANRSFCKTLGVSPQEVAGRTDHDFFPRELAEKYRADDRKVLQTGQTIDTIEEHPGDGTRSWFQVVKTPVRNAQGQIAGVLGIFWDVTERKRAEEALKASEANYRSIFDAANDAIFVHDLETGDILDVNQKMLEMYGGTREEIRQLKVGHFSSGIPPYAQGNAVEWLRKAIQGKPQVFEWLAKARDGRLFWVEVNLKRAVIGGKDRILAVVREITDRKRAEEALREERDRAELYLEMAGVLFVALDKDGNSVLLNRKARELLGCGNEVLGQNWFDLFVPERMRGEVKALFGKLMRGDLQPGEYFENPVVTTQGEERLILWHNTLLRDESGRISGTLSSGEDVTDRRRAEERLKLTQFAVDRASVAVYWMEADARLLYANDAACRSLGYTREELLTLSVPDVDPDFPVERWPVHWEELRRRGAFTFETRHRRKDGTIFPVEVTVNRLEFAGKEYNFAFARDITERKQAEEERRRFEAQIQHAQKLESLGVLAGGIAHDFNNLLTGILGNASLALMDLTGESPVRYSVEQIEVAARRAAELTNQMLAYSGKGRFVIRHIDLSRLVAEMANLLHVAISRKAVLRYQLATHLPAIEADASQIRQVVMNLITNASDAIGEQSGVIRIVTEVVDADRAYLAGCYLDDNLPAGRYVCVEVSDTGCGMDEQTKAKIFDPFFTTKFTGRGLGLAAVLGIVRGHRGAIRVYTEPGRGTTFKVLLPCSEQAVAMPNANEKPVEAWRGSGTVLVVDDEASIRTVARAMLERVGFKVLTACNGAEGIEAFRQHAEEIVAVVLDLTMPDMEGEEAYRELRRIRADVRVILSSGYNEQEATNRFLGEGLAGFIQKPYQAATLYAKLREALEPGGKRTDQE
jgi:two-component system cell cycle sensor histidine kinase/response regulator CckA